MLHSAATPKKTLHITVNTDVPWYSMSPSVTMAMMGMSQTRSDKQILYAATTQFGNFKTGLSLCIMFWFRNANYLHLNPKCNKLNLI